MRNAKAAILTSLLVACAAMAADTDYKKFAMERDGDAARGKALFEDQQRLGCTKCHSVEGKGGKAGPDLFAAGDQFPRSDLIEAILHPSATIAVGYSTTIVETKSGDEYSGVLKQSTSHWLELACGDGSRQRVPTAEIVTQRISPLSLMPEGLQLSLSPDEFCNLIQYLTTLKEPESSLVTHRGMREQIPPSPQKVTLTPILAEPLRIAASDIHAPGKFQTGLVAMAQIPGSPNTFLSADQSGLIFRINRDGAKADVSRFANLTREVFSASGPNGLLGLAFHPKFQDNRKYYLKKQVFEDGKISTVIVERRVTPELVDDPCYEARRLLKVVAVAEHHNGGCLAFGPDGFLYIGMGDSAPNHDPQGHGQDLRMLLGKMLRIDVDRPDASANYGIPTDNPFGGRTDARPEIWASGFREPWRFSFDRLTGDLWVADLGQERGDEIGIVRRGENHGWNVYEGFGLFSPKHRRDGVEYIAPIFSTRRKQGAAIVGGHVYRGNPQSPFYGAYLFGDHVSKRIWALRQQDRTLKEIHELAVAPQSITAFEVDDAGRIYVVGYQGMIYELKIGP